MYDLPAACAGHDSVPSSKISPVLQGLERFTQEWMDVTLVVLIAGGEYVGHAWVAKGKQGRDVWDVLQGVKLGVGTDAVMQYSE